MVTNRRSTRAAADRDVTDAFNIGLDFFNISVNDSAAAGQTVEHPHVHVIPRRKGHVPDPRGGIRWIIDENAKSWATSAAVPRPPTRFGFSRTCSGQRRSRVAWGTRSSPVK